MKKKINLLLAIYCLLLIVFSIYSYSQVDLNLTLSKSPGYLSFQSLMTRLGYYNRPLSTAIFVLLCILLFTVYCLLFTKAAREKKLFVGRWSNLVIMAFILLLSYPAFSHDLFNYIFNAKIVWLYKQNPHQQAASYFIHDVWLRFMRNIHTPAPYAYGWTVLSLVPGVLTLTQNLKLSLWGMKLFIGFYWAGQLWVLQKLIRRNYPQGRWRWFLFALNPLVLIETLTAGHNDVAMMFFALISFWFLQNAKKLVSKDFLLSLLFLGLSASIKYATIVLLPLWIISLVFKKRLNLPAVASLLLFAILFTRPDQLHSWYLIWSFSFAVLSKNKLIISIFTALTFGALLRYAPYLYYGSWDPPVYFLRNMIWLVSIGTAPFLMKFFKNPGV